jgi:hypothetical protein
LRIYCVSIGLPLASAQRWLQLDGSQSDITAPTEPDGVVEGEFDAETPAGFDLDAKRLL